MNQSHQQHQAHVARSRQLADQNNERTRKRSQQHHRELFEKQSNEMRDRKPRARGATSSSLPTSTLEGPAGHSSASGSGSGVGAFQVLSLIVTVLSITIGGAELAHRLWGLGPSPSDVAVDFIDRVSDAEGAPEQKPETQRPSLSVLAQEADELQEIVTEDLDRQPPSAPTNLQVTTEDGCSKELVWDPVSDPDVATYVIRETTGMSHAVDASQTSFTFKVFPGSSTTVDVRARDADHNESGSSNKLTLTC